MKYIDAPDIAERINKIIDNLNLQHIDKNRISCIRSSGSKTRGDIARCHTLSKVLQHSMREKGFYVIRQYKSKFPDLIFANKDFHGIVECKYNRYTSKEENIKLWALAQNFGFVALRAYPKKIGRRSFVMFDKILGPAMKGKFNWDNEIEI